MFFFNFVANSFAVTMIFRTVSADLGINCEGSGRCKGKDHGSGNPTENIRNALAASPLDLSTVYNSGEHISCIDFRHHAICLFLQGASLTLGQIKPLIDALIDHKCMRCGSIPIHLVDQGSNDPSSGILTFNYSQDTDCTGICIIANPYGGESAIPETTISVTSWGSFMNPPASATDGASPESVTALPIPAINTVTNGPGDSMTISGF